MEKKQKTPKEKRRNMERRKEKSRDAARCRRSKETEIFTDLSSMLPFSKNDSISHLDKASIIRIAISYLKIRAIVQSMPITYFNNNKPIEICDADSLFQNALEGFLLVTTTDGDIVFISDNVQRYLGLSQIDLLGQSMYDLCHPCDHVEIKEMLSTKDRNSQKSYFLRMKCTLTNKGRNVNIKSASYKVIQYTGRLIKNDNKPYFNNLKEEYGSNEEDSNDSFKSDILPLSPVKISGGSSFHFVALGEPISHPANIEIPLGRNTFLTKHALDMKFTYADEKISDFFGYNPDDLLEKSVFDYHHAEDSVALRECYKNLFQKGQSQTERYRFLASGGGYAWVLTQATVIYNNATQKPQSVVCVNFVISGVESKHEIYSLCQIEKDCSTTSAITTGIVQSGNDDKLISDVNDGCVYEKLPQRLIEKLSIDTGSPPAVITLKNVTGSCSSNTNNNNNNNEDNKSFHQTNIPVRQNQYIAAGDLPSTENKKSFRGLRRVQLLSVSDFLVPCSSSSSSVSNTSKSESQSPNLNDDWLMTTSSENPSPSEFTVSSVNLTPTKVEIKLPEKLNRSKLPERVCVTSKIFSSSVETPKPATVDVFVPFTEDMNKGFLGFADDETGLTMLKEDPEDLTHLAPTAGDVCVPLDETPIEYVLPDMLDDIILSDCKLLSNDNADSYLSSSPNSFFSYRDDLESSSRPLSPMLSQTEDCSIPSLCSDDSPLHNNGVNPFLDFEGLMHSSDEIDELSAKNSLIPLTLDSDPILPFVANDFMWGSSSEESAWSSVSSSPTSNCSLSPRLDHNSSLAKLLTANPVHSYDGGGADNSEDGGNSGSRRRTTEATNKRNISQHEGIVNTNRNYSNTSSLNNKMTTLYQRSTSVNSHVEGNKRRNNNSMSRMTNSAAVPATNMTVNGNLRNGPQILGRDMDKRTKGGHGADAVIGSKRSSPENWGRTNTCKRSKQAAKTIIISAAPSNGTSGVGGRKMHDSATAMAEAVAATKQTNSVLMNLLVSGCDLNAGYDEDKFKPMLNQAQDNDQDIKLIEDAITNGYFSDMNPETWSRIKREFFSPKNITKIPSFLGLSDIDCGVNIPTPNSVSQNPDFFCSMEYI